jgi:Secretion system C-terminal sorting domain
MKKLLFFTIVLALTLSTQNAFAANITWTGATSTAWATASNWSPMTVPADGDDVVIPNVNAGSNRYPVITTTTAILLSLNTVAQATITIGNLGHLKIGGAYSISLLGTTNIITGGQWTIQGSLVSVNISGNLTNGGTINLTEDANVSLDQNDMPNKAINNGTINVMGNGFFSPNAGILENNGTINIVDATAFLFPISNGGVLNKSTGIINNAGSLSISSTNSLENNGTINNTGTYSSTGTYSGTGNFINSTSTGKVLAAGVDCNSFTKLSLLSTASTHFDLGAGAACTGFDRLAISGLATLAGSFTASGTVTVGNTFIVMTYGTKSGTFSNTSHTITAGKIAVMDYTTAGQVKINIVATLPIELLSFKATPSVSSNLLAWTTANEVNNKGFDIERSIDGTTFSAFGQVKGANKPRTYQYVDNQPFNTTYYRLKQIDFDGTETYSKIVSVELKGKAKGLKVYPTLVSDGVLTVEVIARNEATEGRQLFDFSVTNLLGQQVLTGKTSQQIDVSALAKGTYILKVGAEQVKFVKQ